MNNRLNDCGVYVDCEEVKIFHIGKNYGCIYLAEDVDGWRFGLTWDKAYNTREEALKQGCEKLKHHAHGRLDSYVEEYVAKHFLKYVQLTLF